MSLAGSMLTAATLCMTDDELPSIVGVSPFLSEDSDIRLEFEDYINGVCPITGDEVRFLPAAATTIEQTIEDSAHDKETGGVLFGFRDDYLKITWVVAATGPPADSQASTTCFVCGVDGVAGMAKDWQSKTHGLVGFIGSWHSHPVSSPTPSVTDLDAMKDLLRQSDSPLHRLLLTIVGFSASTPEFGAFIFHREDSEDEEPVA